MPPLPAVPAVLECVLNYTDGIDLNAINRLFVTYTGSVPTGPDLVDLAGQIGTAWVSAFQDYLVTDISFSRVVLTDLTSPTSARGEASGFGPGVNGGAYLGAGTAFLINAQIGRRYRGGKPRSYIPGLDQAALSNPQTWGDATVAALTDAMTGFTSSMEGMASGGCVLAQTVNVSYYSGFLAVENPITLRYRNVPQVRDTPVVDVITGYVGSAKVASQRRRNLQKR